MSNDRERLKRLVEMATLVVDAKSSSLRQANGVRDALLQQLRALDPSEAPVDLPWSVAETTLFGYEQWAVRRRAEINLRLAAQTAVCLQAAEETRLVFGRKMAVEQVAVTRLRR